MTLVSEPEEKIYRVSFHNRRRLDNFDSVPFGYTKDEQGGSTSMSLCEVMFVLRFELLITERLNNITSVSDISILCPHIVKFTFL